MIQAGLVVGCGEFLEPNISSLKYAARDAERFSRCLIDFCGLESDNIALLADARAERERPSVANITRTISIIEQRCSRQQVGRIILYLSGHGVISPNHKNLYFVCRETYDGDIEKTAISIDSIITRIRNAKPLEAIVILDTCRTGSIKNKGIDDSQPFLEPNRLSGPGMVVIYSCQLGQRSYESDALKAGLFTEVLLRGLGETGECTGIRDLKNYLDRELPVLSRAESKPVQMPYFVLENAALSDLVIVAPDVYAQRRQSLILRSEVYNQDDLPTFRLTEKPKLCGIDFGTTKSLVTAYDSTRGVVYIPCIGNAPLLRSSLFVHPDYRFRVGQSAFEHYRTRRSGYIQDIKRRIGQSQIDRVDAISLDASSCIAMILSSIRRTLSLVSGSDVNQAVISFPVNFTWRQHQELVQAFTTAGFEICRAVSEAAAAAVALEATEHTQGTVFILDVGGGTFDACLAILGDGVIEIIDVYGDRELGGRDFDEALRSLVNIKIDSLNSTAQGKYWIPHCSAYDEQIENIKFQINTTESGSYQLTGVPTVTGNEVEINVPITLEEFKQISRDICFRVRSRLTSALSKFRNARPSENINLIMLAGQASKCVLFVRKSRESFPVFQSSIHFRKMRLRRD
jgi:uncharacterized caspase-like protein